MQNGSPTDAVILLRREGTRWLVEVDEIAPEMSRTGASLADVLVAAREAIGDRRFKLKVKPGTELGAEDVLKIVKAHAAADLSKCRMANIDLSFDTHHFVNDPPFRGAELLQVEFREANLAGALLPEAWLNRLQGANLSNAQLQGAYLDNADLRGANLSGAVLRGAYLQRARLQNANLSRAQLQEARLGGAHLKSYR